LNVSKKVKTMKMKQGQQQKRRKNNTTTKKAVRRGAKLGQHLLTSTTIARQVAVAGGVREGDSVLEVGPGKGMLTRELLALGAHVVAIEKDRGMVTVLRNEFAAELESGKLSLLEGDARDALNTERSIEALHKHTMIYHSVFALLKNQYKVVANIPYYITGELIRLFLTALHQPASIALLVQKEVAERIAREKKESLLSLSVKAYGTPRYVRTVKAGSFNPPPNVDSAILAITAVSRDRFKDVREEDFFTILKIGFGQKRKTLMGNLKKSDAYEEADIRTAFEQAGIGEKARAEDVPLESWFRLVQALTER